MKILKKKKKNVFPVLNIIYIQKKQFMTLFNFVKISEKIKVLFFVNSEINLKMNLILGKVLIRIIGNNIRRKKEKYVL